MPLYPGASVPEHWVANLRDKVMEVYTAPADDQYRSRRTVGLDGVLQPRRSRV